MAKNKKVIFKNRNFYTAIEISFFYWMNVPRDTGLRFGKINAVVACVEQIFFLIKKENS